ncbi:iron-sulfur cluster co-chaperone protein HscB isoform X2 [Macrosteles quadrilineatus]|uniref:iron-sulfur cluster co-chaperone protein HscB isoform X2 n=1 Tax=Macrosteles quadrilineatus TaxID=74068 RepID=UPI0023E11E77|nr:iron-sulfur cluster co-chaperone protein HscB isoform X2 [Macrosteles quadrilineatus]
MFKWRQCHRISSQFEHIFLCGKGERERPIITNSYFSWSRPILKKDQVLNKLITYKDVNCTCNLYTEKHIYSPNVSNRHLQYMSNNPTCWNCQAILTDSSNKLFCVSCNSLQPVDRQANLFDILGVKKSYSLDQLELKKKFRDLQSLLHPDKFSAKPKREQELSEEFSSIVNKAYSTLLNPLERGLYMLSLNNMSIEEGTTDIDKSFLMEIMEKNEEIENQQDPVKLNEIYKSNKEQLDLLIRYGLHR